MDMNAAAHQRRVQVVSPPPPAAHDQARQPPPRLGSAEAGHDQQRAQCGVAMSAPRSDSGRQIVRPSSHTTIGGDIAPRQRQHARRPQSAAAPTITSTCCGPAASMAALRPHAAWGGIEGWSEASATLQPSRSAPALHSHRVNQLFSLPPPPPASLMRSVAMRGDAASPTRRASRASTQSMQKHDDEEEEEGGAFTFYDYHSNLKRPVCPPRPALRLGARPPVPGSKLGAKVTPHEFGRRLLASQSTWASQIPSDLDWFCSVISVAPPPRGRHDPVFGRALLT